MKRILVENNAPVTEDPYCDLAHGVIIQAARDYRLLGEKLLGTEDQSERDDIKKRMQEISRFFLSDWYSFLSGHENGAAVLSLLDAEVFGSD